MKTTKHDLPSLNLSPTEIQVLAGMIDRAYYDLQDYYLGERGKADLGWKYASLLFQTASECRQMAGAMFMLGIDQPDRAKWIKLAEMMERIGRREEREAQP